MPAFSNTEKSFPDTLSPQASWLRATGADPKVLAVIRGAVMPTWPVEALRTIEVPVLILNGRADAANQKIDGHLGAMITARHT